jgi:hypothetical protein
MQTQKSLSMYRRTTMLQNLPTLNKNQHQIILNKYHRMNSKNLIARDLIQLITRMGIITKYNNHSIGWSLKLTLIIVVTSRRYYLRDLKRRVPYMMNSANVSQQ